MPRIVPQHLKTLSTIGQQPKQFNTQTLRIILLDIAGKGTNEIAAIEGLTAARVSQIKTCPMFVQQRAVEWDNLRTKVTDKTSDMIAGDPVESALKEAALEAANVKIELMRTSQNEYVKSGASSDILDRAGYKSHTEKTKITVQVTEKMANRFERVLEYGSAEHEPKTTVCIEEEVSE